MLEDPIAILEDRVRVLETKIFGQCDSNPEITPIVDNLLESHKVISTALSGREKMTAVVKRLDQLETFLDPMYEDTVVDSTAKLAFILSMERELEDITKQLIRLNELSPCLESEQLRNIPQLMKQMAKLTTITIEQKEKHNLQQDQIDDLIARYNEIIEGVNAVFIILDNLVNDLEIKARPKQILD